MHRWIKTTAVALAASAAVLYGYNVGRNVVAARELAASCEGLIDESERVLRRSKPMLSEFFGREVDVVETAWRDIVAGYCDGGAHQLTWWRWNLNRRFSNERVRRGQEELKAALEGARRRCPALVASATTRAEAKRAQRDAACSKASQEGAAETTAQEVEEPTLLERVLTPLAEAVGEIDWELEGVKAICQVLEDIDPVPATSAAFTAWELPSVIAEYQRVFDSMGVNSDDSAGP